MAVQVEARPRPAPPAEAASREQIVEAHDVVKTYDTGKVEVHALRGVTFGVGRGEMVAIMGPSGSGKTTLLNCLSGLDSINGGDVLIEGVSLAAMSDRERTDYRARRMGFVFQFYNLMPVLSSVENVELPLLVAGVSPKDARRRALDALELVGLREWAEHIPDELSGGQRQRVTIARALVNNPAIVWADEPTGDLDSENADEIVALMRQLNEEHGLTFLIVTHDIGVGRKTDRIVRMVDGQIVSDEILDVPGRELSGKLAAPGRRRVASSALTATKKVDGQIVSEENLEVAALEPSGGLAPPGRRRVAFSPLSVAKEEVNRGRTRDNR